MPSVWRGVAALLANKPTDKIDAAIETTKYRIAAAERIRREDGERATAEIEVKLQAATRDHATFIITRIDMIAADLGMHQVSHEKTTALLDKILELQDAGDNAAILGRINAFRADMLAQRAFLFDQQPIYTAATLWPWPITKSRWPRTHSNSHRNVPLRPPRGWRQSGSGDHRSEQIAAGGLHQPHHDRILSGAITRLEALSAAANATLNDAGKQLDARQAARLRVRCYVLPKLQLGDGRAVDDFIHLPFVSGTASPINGLLVQQRMRREAIRGEATSTRTMATPTIPEAITATGRTRLSFCVLSGRPPKRHPSRPLAAENADAAERR